MAGFYRALYAIAMHAERHIVMANSSVRPRLSNAGIVSKRMDIISPQFLDDLIVLVFWAPRR